MRALLPCAAMAAFFSLISVATGCGGKSDDAVVPPDAGDSGTGDSGHVVVDEGGTRDEGGTLDAGADAMSNELAFDTTFVSHPLTCTSQGVTQIVAPLAAGRFQFGDCSFDLEALPTVHGDVAATVVSGPAEPEGAPWSVTVTRSSETKLSVRASQHRQERDWSDAPLVLRFDFHDSSGRAVFTTLTLTPAEETEIVRFDVPRVPDTFEETVKGQNGSPDTHLRHHVRHNTDGIPVFRTNEAVVFEAPFTVAKDVTVTRLEGGFEVKLDSRFTDDTCLFAEMPSDFFKYATWEKAAFTLDSGSDRLSLLLDSHSPPHPCDHLAAGTHAAGTVQFNANLSATSQQAKFDIALADTDISKDLIFLPVATNGVVDEIRIENGAPYDLPLLHVYIATPRCVGGDPPVAGSAADFALEILGAAPDANGVVDVAPIPAGSTRSIPAASLASALRGKITALGLSCASKQWSFQDTLVEESANGAPFVSSATTLLHTQAFTIAE